MPDRLTKKMMRAQLLKMNPQAIYPLLVELQDMLEHRLELAKGDKGDTGYTPIKGHDYRDGKDGYTPIKNRDYFDGKDGIDGYTPRKGVDYFDGREGKPGRDGVDATPFDPSFIYAELKHLKAELEAKDITVEQVINAIKNLSGEDRIDARSIKNLPTAPIQPSFGKKKKIDFSDMRWHGGGGDLSVANFTTVVPSGLINGVNVTYTVPTTIHSVINFNINGEFIAPNQYSFINQTITLFEPLDISLAGLPFYITYV